MGALAYTDPRARGASARSTAHRPGPPAAQGRRLTSRRQAGWNVLAEELVPFPPASVPPSRQAEPAPTTASAAERPDRRHVPGPRRAAPRTRGSRRLLPGAATLAVLAGCWFGVGALAGVRHPALTVLPGAVRVPGGYVYVARPGDTLWSIASRLEPGGDPRVLVANLERQLRGGVLLAGEELKLP